MIVSSRLFLCTEYDKVKAGGILLGKKGGRMTGFRRKRFAGRRAWRHRLAREDSRGRRCRKSRRRLQGMLSMTAAAEAAYLTVVTAGRMDVKLIRREEQYQVEWIQPWDAGRRNAVAGLPGAAWDEDGEIYGIRLCPDTLEIQFYSRSHSIRDDRSVN